MENTNQGEKKDYQFIHEKVVSKRKNRLKRMFLSFGFTVFLAVVFGIVARLVFLYADAPLRKLFGVGEPSPTPVPAAPPSPTPTPRPTPAPIAPVKPITSLPEPQLTEEALPNTGQPAPPNATGNPVNPGAENPTPPNPTGNPNPGVEDLTPPGSTEDPAYPGAENLTPPGSTENPAHPGAENPPPGSTEDPAYPGVENPTPPGSTGNPANPGAENPPPPGSTEDPAHPGAENPTPPGSTGEPTPAPERTDYISLFKGLRETAETAGKALVTVTTSITKIDWLNDPYETESQTTGIVIEKNAQRLLILVNLDRVQSASNIGLTIDGQYFAADLLDYNKDYNLAVLAVDSSHFPERFFNMLQTAVWGNDDPIKAGTPILALGNPNGYIGSMEFGMITSSGSTYYITDGSVNLFNTNTTDSENGDGVIINLDGEIIGVITRTLKSNLNETMCTAISISDLKSVIEKLALEQKTVYLGIQGEDIPSAVLEEEGLENGIYVSEVLENSPAQKAGIKTGDIILTADENNIHSYKELREFLDSHKDGDEVKIIIRRTVRTYPRKVEAVAELAGK